jgi:hypothetical protein
MRAVIRDAMFPATDLLTVDTEQSAHQLLYIAAASAASAPREVAIALDLEGALSLSAVLIDFIRNHPEARR